MASSRRAIGGVTASCHGLRCGLLSARARGLRSTATRRRRKGTWELGTTTEGKSAFGADPKVPSSANGRGVLRGGSWDYAVTSAKVTYRLPFQPSSGNVSIGFRCARDVE